MTIDVVLLRGINIGSANRIAMPALREVLDDAGYKKVQTHLQSGNILLESGLEEHELAMAVEQLITERFGLSIPAIAREAPELARVVAANPFPEEAAQDPKRLQVTFLRGELEAVTAERLSALATPAERIVVGEREIYAWHPDGVAGSKLAAKLAAKNGLGHGVVGSARNWTTVVTLQEMADRAR
jgi:uncharacterized protein (DUF1697 family)